MYHITSEMFIGGEIKKITLYKVETLEEAQEIVSLQYRDQGNTWLDIEYIERRY